MEVTVCVIIIFFSKKKGGLPEVESVMCAYMCECGKAWKKVTRDFSLPSWSFANVGDQFLLLIDH